MQIRELFLNQVNGLISIHELYEICIHLYVIYIYTYKLTTLKGNTWYGAVIALIFFLTFYFTLE